jgi:hypothetical protein
VSGHHLWRDRFDLGVPRTARHHNGDLTIPDLISEIGPVRFRSETIPDAAPSFCS